MDKIGSLLNSSPALPSQNISSAVSKSSADFGEMLTSMVETVNNSQIDGDKAIENLQTGNAQHLHEVMLTVEQADMSLRMLVQIRNKALTAYEEIMRMQI